LFFMSSSQMEVISAKNWVKNLTEQSNENFGRKIWPIHLDSCWTSFFKHHWRFSPSVCNGSTEKIVSHVPIFARFLGNFFLVFTSLRRQTGHNIWVDLPRSGLIPTNWKIAEKTLENTHFTAIGPNLGQNHLVLAWRDAKQWCLLFS
jgi:hypothetical protein